MHSDPEGSVTRWIVGLKEGDPQAAQHLWQRYFHRLVALARVKLGHAPRTAVDEEDAALSAFCGLCDGAAHGQFGKLGDREDLWRLLVVLTARKSIDQKKRTGRLKRGGGKVLCETALIDEDAAEAVGALSEIAGKEPTPELAALLAEEFRSRLDTLATDELRHVASLRLEGYGNDEIAERLGCARRTVARRLEIIRMAWN